MAAKSPEEVHSRFTKAFTVGDVEALVALYEENATLLPQPGKPVSGKAAIRDALSGFLALKGKFTMDAPKSLVSGDLAILYANWALHARDPQGKELILSGKTTDVVRRQNDGTWLFVIDNPYGGPGLENL